MADALLEDLGALLCFARVVEHASFTRAAAVLGVSKSVVSTKTSSLEARLGEQLLLRSTRRVVTTEAGLRIYGQARRMIEAASAATRDTGEASRSVLRISAPVSLAQLHLGAPIAAFLRQSPGVRVELVLDDRIVDIVEERIDVAVRITKLANSSLIARRLGATSMHVCGSPAYFTRRGRPERPEDLVRHDCLRYARMRADHEWRLYGPGGRIALDVDGSLSATNGTMLRQAAIEGVGLTLLPRFMVADALKSGALETVLEAFAPRPVGIYAVRSGRRKAPPLIARLIDHLALAFRGPAWRAASTG